MPVGSLGLGTYFTGAKLGMYGEAGWNIVDALGGTALSFALSLAATFFMTLSKPRVRIPSSER